MAYTSNQTQLGPYEISELCLIKAVSNIHPGVGRTGEIVDLPVQRDNLGYPIVYSSSIKGALKSIFWNLSENLREQVKILFGPDPDTVDDERFSSAVAVLDANVVVFPVRSLEGVYAYATSPFLLKRLSEILDIANRANEAVKKLIETSIGKDEAIYSDRAANKLAAKDFNNKVVVNEELQVSRRAEAASEVEKLEEFLGIESGRLLVLNDDDALYALERSMVRVTRIRIDRSSKTVAEGALWSEECIPRGTVFYTLFLFSRGRDVKQKRFVEPVEVKNSFHQLLEKTRRYAIIGGDETIGRGVIKFEFIQK
ncbi:MAG: type III-B CRISPR module RAMP protein Cmr4 [Candidatus Caldarchaeum sp.]